MTLSFIQPPEGTRILLMLGKHQMGAIFPPSPAAKDKEPWNWGFWFGSNGGNCWKSGRAKSELTAKNAILAHAEQWLRDAGLPE
jgi:hypothetical protein